MLQLCYYFYLIFGDSLDLYELDMKQIQGKCNLKRV